MKLFKVGIFIIVWLFSLPLCANSSKKDDYLKHGFVCPPESTRPIVYWYLMNGHLSKDGITKDLEAMSKVGIGEVFLGNIYLTRLPPGPVKIFTPEWKECMQHAVKETARLGIKISFFNSPGWSQSGGPWVQPDHAMRYLTYSDTIVCSDGMVAAKMSRPQPFFQDVALLAFRYKDRVKTAISYHSFPEGDKLSNLFDRNRSTKCVFKNQQGQSVCVDIKYEKEFTARSLSVNPTNMNFQVSCEVFVWKDGEYKLVKKHFFDRLNKDRQLGPLLNAEMVAAIGEVKGRDFRVVFNGVPASFELEDIQLSEENKLEEYNEKWLNKLPHTWKPGWNAYQWSTQEQINQSGVLNKEDVWNISSFLHGDSVFWQAPKGVWKILRIGMTTTGTTNLPAPPNATGLEIDKMNREVLLPHYEAYIGQIMDGLSPKESRAFNRIIADSYETGPQNWTDNMRPDFIARYGYDPLPYLPSLAGIIIDSAEKTNRFLWDIRRMIADKVADEYVGGLRKLCENKGIRLWVENYGHWGFPSEFLKYGGQSHDIGGEFWTHGMNDFECRLAASACHIYGKKKVYAESYTSSGRFYERYPGELKRIGDWSYCEGINHGVLHLYMHQPYENKYPGVNAWFGIEYNRNNTWYEQSKSWIDYQRRCYFMLEQGMPVADVCFFVGEDVPKMAGWKDTSLSKGYNFDFINSDVIENQMYAKNGRVYLPNGNSYALLVLPPLNTMRPSLLKKIRDLVDNGAKILGIPPLASPSLSNYPECDTQVRSLSEYLWGDLDNMSQIVKRKVGKGLVMSGLSVNEALKNIDVQEDLSIQEDSILWVHRGLSDGDIYFLSNQKNKPAVFNASFRVANKQPELWNAIDGSTRFLAAYKNENGRTTVPLYLEAGESCFVVFQEETKSMHYKDLKVEQNFPKDKCLLDISNSWNIHFSNKWLGTDFTLKEQSLFDWSKSDNPNVRYFSGSAVYSTDFEITEKKSPLYLCFSDIKVIATIKLNGQDVGTLWCPPYRINITDEVKVGKNRLEVTVTNLWVNQLVWQAQKEKEERKTWLLEENINPNQPLASSGLIGKSWIVSNKY